MSSRPLYFFEQTDFSLRLARCADGERPLRINEVREVGLADASTLVATVPADSIVACAVRPKSRTLHFATPEEAQRYAGLAGIRNFVARGLNSAADLTWFSAVQAYDGAPPATAPWLLSISNESPLPDSFKSLSVKPVRCVSATLTTVGALARTAAQPVLLIELGEIASHALLVGREGILAAGKISLNLNTIGEAVQAELNLKFRGSATKLFLNADYDFSEVGSKIAARLAPSLKTELEAIPGSGTPVSLFVAGLPAAQEWFGRELAAVLGLANHIPDFKAWSALTGITFSTAELMASLSPAWFGTLDFVHAVTLTKAPGSASWVAEWLSLASITPTAEPAPTPAPTPKEDTPVVRMTQTAAGTPVPVPEDVTRPATRPPLPSASKTPFEPPKYSTQSAPSIAGFEPTPPHKDFADRKLASLPKDPSPGRPPDSAPPKFSPPPPTRPSDALKAPARRKKNLTRLLIIIGVTALLVALGYVYLTAKTDAVATAARAKEQAERQLASEETKARLAAQNAAEEAALRQKDEAEQAEKLREAEAARERAAAKTLAETAARQANARGSLKIATYPEGATVKVDDLPPLPSPATFSFVRVGTYPVVISLPNYEEVRLELEVRENALTESGPIELTRLAGSLQITAEPGAATYELRPVNPLSTNTEIKRTGSTPVALNELEPGDYTLTLSRQGWASQSQVVSIIHNSITHLRWEWPNGRAAITSNPAGATVIQAGKVLGETPLQLSDLPPGDTRFELRLDRFDPIPLVAKIEAGAAIELSGEFKSADQIFTLQEVDRKPEPVGVKQPVLPYYLNLEGGRVEIELTIGRDGSPRNLSIAQASNPDLGTFCLAAVAKWQFKPGVKAGSPVNVKLKLPFAFKAAKS